MESVLRGPRRIEYRWFVAGREVDPEAFFTELRRLGGRAVVETVDLTEPRYRPTPKGEAALNSSPDLTICDWCGQSFPTGTGPEPAGGEPMQYCSAACKRGAWADDADGRAR